MPTYSFINQATGEVEDHFMSHTELDDFQKTNPHLDGMKEVFSRIAEKNPGSNLDSYRSKTISEVKTKEVLNKHRNRK